MITFNDTDNVTLRSDVDTSGHGRLFAKKGDVETQWAILRSDGYLQLIPNQPDFGWARDAQGKVTLA